MKKTLSILVSLLLIIVTTGFIANYTQDSDKLDKSPEYKKGTFWKDKNEQLTTFTGEKANHSVNSSCYIDLITTYKGVDAYQATYLIQEEHKIVTFFIEKKNFRILDAVGLFTNYNSDTIALDFEILNFPLYKGKTWENICKYQEFPRKPITSYNSKFEVTNVKDSILNVNGSDIKTKAFFLKGELTSNNKTSFGNYVYLAPSKNFPGTCPIFLWNQFFKNLSYGKENKVIRKYTPTDFNW